jgi:hypothetical protein
LALTSCGWPGFDARRKAGHPPPQQWPGVNVREQILKAQIFLNAFRNLLLASIRRTIVSLWGYLALPGEQAPPCAFGDDWRKRRFGRDIQSAECSRAGTPAVTGSPPGEHLKKYLRFRHVPCFKRESVEKKGWAKGPAYGMQVLPREPALRLSLLKRAEVCQPQEYSGGLARRSPFLGQRETWTC